MSLETCASNFIDVG